MGNPTPFHSCFARFVIDVGKRASETQKILLLVCHVKFNLYSTVVPYARYSIFLKDQKAPAKFGLCRIDTYSYLTTMIENKNEIGPKKMRSKNPDVP